jgi:hypothetical protein
MTAPVSYYCSSNTLNIMHYIWKYLKVTAFKLFTLENKMPFK